jgi:hypothetical protein
MVDFDWKHPTKLDRALVEELLRLDFLSEAANVVLLGPNLRRSLKMTHLCSPEVTHPRAA